MCQSDDMCTHGREVRFVCRLLLKGTTDVQLEQQRVHEAVRPASPRTRAQEKLHLSNPIQLCYQQNGVSCVPQELR